MKKCRLIGLILICFCLFLVGCERKVELNYFTLEDKYYDNSSFIELSVDDYDKLINDQESFALFVYQPMCVASSDFESILTKFSNTYKITFYKMPFKDMKELNKDIEYYPSMVIYNKGQVVDFLDANSDEDTDYFLSVEDFTSWFSHYVYFDKDVTLEDDENLNDSDKAKEITYELDDVTYNENKVNIYLFWGNGCPHCEEEQKFFKEIEAEYGKYFNLHKYEVWYDDRNEKILEEFANCMGDKVSGVPYTVIGNKTFSGFSDSSKEEFIKAIKDQHNNSYDVYFDKKVN